VKTLRALRAAESLKRQRNEKFHAFALSGNALTLGIVKPHELEIRTLANLSSFEVMLRGEDKAFVVCWEEIEIWISYNVLYFILCKLCPSF